MWRSTFCDKKKYVPIIFIKLLVLVCFVSVKPVKSALIQSQQQIPQQPCDKTRRIFLESYGEISDGPAGSNYTQVCSFISLINKSVQGILFRMQEIFTYVTADNLPLFFC